MDQKKIARQYLHKVLARRKALAVLVQEKSYDDVIREAQEIVELVLKGSLRWVGVEPPKYHDPGRCLSQVRQKFPQNWQDKIPHIQNISTSLYEERCQAFYGDDPQEDEPLYTPEEASQAVSWVDELIELYQKLLAG